MTTHCHGNINNAPNMTSTMPAGGLMYICMPVHVCLDKPTDYIIIISLQTKPIGCTGQYTYCTCAAGERVAVRAAVGCSPTQPNSHSEQLSMQHTVHWV